MTDVAEKIAALPDRRLLLLDDDAPLRTRLGRRWSAGFEGFSPAGWSKPSAR